MKNAIVKALMKAVPVCAMLAVVVSANSAASPWNGQPAAPKSLDKYKKF